MRHEELSFAVHQHRVQLGPQLRRGRQPQLVPDAVQHGGERCLPGVAAQRHVVGRDFPGVTHACVGQCLLPAPELRRLRHRDQLLRERGAHRGQHGPDAIDLDLQRVRRCQDLGAERPRRLRVVKQLGQPFPCRATHEPSQIGCSTAATVPPATARRCPLPSPAAGWVKPFVLLKRCPARRSSRGNLVSLQRPAGPARPVPGGQIRDALGEPSLITNLPPEP